MPNYQIITDSCCDLTAAQYRELNVSYAPLSVIFKGETHDNFSEPEQLKEFYDGMRSGEMPTTSAVNPQGWKKIMKPILEDGQDILVLAFSSGVSTTCQSAVIAANELREQYPDRKIHVVDTLCVTMGQALLLWYACRKRADGMSLDDLTAWCEVWKWHVCHWIVVDGLEHLRRGGRISRGTSMAGGMLNIKPVFNVDNAGKLTPPAKARGWKGAMDLIIKNYMEQSAGYDNSVVCVSHGDSPENAEVLANLFREKCGVENVIVSYIGGVIGSHIGPGSLAAFFMGSRR